MALLTSGKELEHLIPEPNEEYYMSRITYAPTSVVNEKPIFAFVVSKKTNEVISIYRVNFVLFSASNSNYLFVSDMSKDLSSKTYYISAEARGNKKLTKDKWKFETDEIGLHIVVDNITKDTIYFGTSYTDVTKVREGVKNRKEKPSHEVTLVTETVYV